MADEASSWALGDLVKIERGSTYKSALLGDEGPVLLGLATIAPNGGFRSDSLRRYSGASPERMIVEPGELYASLKDVTQSGDLLGAVARFPDHLGQGRLTQDTVKLVPKDDGAVLRYLYWVLRTPQYRDYCRAHATGTTTLGLPREDFLAFKIPALNRVRLVLVDVLNTIEDKIDLNRRMSETVRALSATIFKSRFIDFDGQEDLVDSELGLIPTGWRPGTLGDVAEITMGQSPPGSTYNTVEDGLPFFQGATDFGAVFPTNRIHCTDPKRFASEWDVLMSVRAPVGRTNLATEHCAIGRGVASIRSRLGRFPAYIWTLVNSLSSVLDVYNGEGTVFGSINKKALHAIPVVVPPVDTLFAYEAVAGPLISRMRVSEDESRTLAALRDALLPRLISGALRVSDAERVVNEEV